MVEARDPKRPEYGVITLIFQRKASAPAGLEMYGWVALDSQNNRTSIRLSNAHYGVRSEEHTSELQSLMRISYAVFCLKKKNKQNSKHNKPRCNTYHYTQKQIISKQETTQTTQETVRY